MGAGKCGTGGGPPSCGTRSGERVAVDARKFAFFSFFCSYLVYCFCKKKDQGEWWKAFCFLSSRDARKHKKDVAKSEVQSCSLAGSLKCQVNNDSRLRVRRMRNGTKKSGRKEGDLFLSRRRCDPVKTSGFFFKGWESGVVSMKWNEWPDQRPKYSTNRTDANRSSAFVHCWNQLLVGSSLSRKSNKRKIETPRSPRRSAATGKLRTGEKGKRSVRHPGKMVHIVGNRKNKRETRKEAEGEREKEGEEEEKEKMKKRGEAKVGETRRLRTQCLSVLGTLSPSLSPAGDRRRGGVGRRRGVARLGRGVVRLGRCEVVAGCPRFVLRPSKKIVTKSLAELLSNVADEKTNYSKLSNRSRCKIEPLSDKISWKLFKKSGYTKQQRSIEESLLKCPQRIQAVILKCGMNGELNLKENNKSKTPQYEVNLQWLKKR